MERPCGEGRTRRMERHDDLAAIRVGVLPMAPLGREQAKAITLQRTHQPAGFRAAQLGQGHSAMATVTASGKGEPEWIGSSSFRSATT